ncbi:MAG: 4'-phosphopantetheinyl transferase superfamily protein [Oscillospiraceae bacterium]|nr:4'-phosphopantetheinyl transferase superfamily protein [Oscillospiraceae bacterium]
MFLFATDNLTQRQQAKTLLAYTAAQAWNFPSLPEIGIHSGGKPHFLRNPDHHFNLSHSGSYALCAAAELPVGVDIQIIKTSWRDSLPRRVCSPEQLHWLEQQPCRRHAFTQLWCMKESRVKWDGSGLTHSIPDISVPLPQAEENLYFWDGLWFRLFSGPDWEACVCSTEAPPDTIHWITL